MISDNGFLVAGVESVPVVHRAIEARDYVLMDVHVDLSVGGVGGTSSARPSRAAHPDTPTVLLLRAHALVEEVAPRAEQHEHGDDDDQNDDEEDDDDDDASLQSRISLSDQEAGVGLALHNARVVATAWVASTKRSASSTHRAQD